MEMSQRNQGHQTTKRHTIWRRVLLVLCLFVAVGALGGGGLVVIAPDGSLLGAQAIIPELHNIPLVGPHLDSLLIPGCALLLFVFVPQTIASILLLGKHPKQYTAGIICGAIMAVFTIVEIVFLPNFLSWIFLFFAVVEICAAVLCMRSSQSR